MATPPIHPPSPNSLLPSKPRAPRLVRWLVLLFLLMLALAAIWWIDRGAMRTNTSAPVVPHAH